MNLASFLVAMVGPLAARILASLGLSLVSMAGATVAFDALKSQITSGIGSLGATAIQLGGLIGLWTCVGMVLGAYTFSLTWASTKGFWSLAKA